MRNVVTMECIGIPDYHLHKCRRCKATHCHCCICLIDAHAWIKRQERAYRAFATGYKRAAKYGAAERHMTWVAFLGWFNAHWQDPCAECGASDTQIDHRMPLSKGGAHALENLQMLCVTCNARKCAWLPGEPRVYPWTERSERFA